MVRSVGRRLFATVAALAVLAGFLERDVLARDEGAGVDVISTVLIDFEDFLGLDEPSSKPSTQPDGVQDAEAPTSQEAKESEESEEAEEGPKSILEWDYLTGDWFGARTALSDKGLTFEADYYGTLFVNASGGSNTQRAIEYTNYVSLGLTFDTGKAGLWKGGEIYLLGEGRWGPSISDHVGDVTGVNIDSYRDVNQVTEYWFRQSISDDLLWLKLGKIDAGSDFAVLDTAAEFVNYSMSYNITIPQPIAPDAALGAIVGTKPCEWFYFQAGVFDAEAIGGQWGFHSAFHDEPESFTICEAGIRPKWKLGGRELPGAYKLGSWYRTSDEDVIFNDLGGRRAPRTQTGNYGVYVAIDQLVFKENEAGDDAQGLGLFFQYGWCPDDYNEINETYGGGLAYTGLVPTRDADMFGAGLVLANFSGVVQDLEKRHSETATEVFYRIQLTPWWSLQPDLQYIFSPNGDGQDAFVVGIRTQISF